MNTTDFYNRKRMDF